MSSVPIQDLKQHLSGYVDRAAAGETLVITRHNRPVATLAPHDLQHVRIGASFGKGSLEPLLRRGSRGRFLEVLAADRDAR
jgi:prevent-host-death family protein